MRPYAKMAMISAARSEQNRPDMRRGGRMNDDSRMGYGRSMRYEHEDARYEDGDRRAEMRRYKNGRFAPKNEGDMRYGMEDYGAYDYDDPSYEADMRMNRIGFAAGGNVVDFHTKKMEKSRKPHSASNRFTREMAEEWVEGMKNKDKSRGAHWDLEKVSQLMKQHNLQYDKYEFWAVLNAIYSDYCAVLDKHGVSNMEFYIDLAKAWLDDEDAVDDKAMMYFECVVK